VPSEAFYKERFVACVYFCDSNRQKSVFDLEFSAEKTASMHICVT